MSKRRKLTTDNKYVEHDNDAISTEQEHEEKEDEDDNTVNNKHLSRGKRKRRKKMELKLRKQQLIAKLQQQGIYASNDPTTDSSTTIENKFVFEELGLFLDEEDGKLKEKAERERQRIQGDRKRVTSKKRAKLLTKEVQQLQNVLEHPVFQSTPLHAIQQHLTNKLNMSLLSKKQLQQPQLQQPQLQQQKKTNAIQGKANKKQQSTQRSKSSSTNKPKKKRKDSECSMVKQQKVTGKRKRI